MQLCDAAAAFKLEQADGRGHPLAMEQVKTSHATQPTVAATNSAVLVKVP